MPIDPNIALQVRPVQIESPLKLYAQAAQIKQMQDAIQANQQQKQANAAIQQAFQGAQGTDSQGNPTFNSAAALHAMRQSGQIPVQQQLQIESSLQQQEANRMKAQTDAMRQLAWGVNENDPASYQAMRKQAIEMNLPNAQHLPEQYPGAQKIQQMKMNTLQPHEKIMYDMNQMRLNQQGQLQREKIAASRENKIAAKEERKSKQEDRALQQTMSMLESARGNPSVQQAQKDLYASNKVDSLINMYGDPNKLNPQMVQLVASEVAKIAQGGVPTIHELETLTPSSIPSKLANIAQTYTNSPTAANAGAFLRQFQDYSNLLKKDAREVIKDKYNRVLKSKKSSLSPEDYNTLKDQYLGQAKGLNEEDRQAIKWANKNPNDPRAKEILQMHKE